MSTHRIEEHGEEELAPVDDLVQLAGATRVLIVEDGVCEEAAGLSREDLGMGQGRALTLLCDHTAPTLGVPLLQ